MAQSAPEQSAVSAQGTRPDSSGPGSGPPPRPALSERLPRPWLFPLLVFAATWLLILATWFGTDLIYHQGHPPRWFYGFKDAGFYLGIAEHGYAWTLHAPHSAVSQSGWAAFFPLFPMAIRVVGVLIFGHYLTAALIVVVASGAASALGVWALAARACDPRVADRAVVLYCLFPGAMTFGMLYSEPLGIALSAAALLALLARRWVLAGVCGALCTAERPDLVVIAAVLGLAALHAIWARREWRALFAPALAPLGLLAFFGYLGHRYHDYAFWFQEEQKGWGAHFDGGAHTFRVLFWQLPGISQYPVYNVIIIGVAVFTVAGLGLMIAGRLPVPLTLFSILVFLAVVTASTPGVKPRLVWAAFPVFIGAAAKLPRVIFWPVVIVSAAVLVYLIGWWPHHPLAPAP
ncbi:MAG TPA: hypothetical protein VFX25_15330 [Streptosporangiaceae bacterium]|nr:hypothetical protein [Streptosporangiaceae bacterium]